MIKDNSSDKDRNVTHNSSHILQLKYNNPEGDNSIGFRYSKYKDSEISRLDVNSNLEETSINKSNCCNGSFWKQTRLMTWKNYLVFSRNIKPTIFQLTTPIAICIILVLVQSLMDNFTEGFINKNPELIPISLDKCLYPSNCTTIGYGIIVNK